MKFLDILNTVRRDEIINAYVDRGELISGEEALIALAIGVKLQQRINDEWIDLRRDISWRSILGCNYIIRLTPLQ